MTFNFPPSTLGDGDALIDEALETVRTHFNMPIAYLAEFVEDRMVFRNVSAPGLEDLLKPGDSRLLKDVYCTRVLRGELPQLIPNTNREPICMDLPITAEVPIGSHISIPIHSAENTVYGSFCCLSPEPNETLNDRDLAVMTNFANLVARQVRQKETADQQASERRAWAQSLLDDEKFLPVFQPLVRLSDRRVLGVEALTRFNDDSGMSTETIFQIMAEVGLGLELELTTMSAAIRDASLLPEDIYLSVNASADLICDPRFQDTLAKRADRDIVIEITEHSLAEDETELQANVSALRAKGFRIAVDDVGVGYSGWQRIAQLSPDILKLDRSIVADVDQSLSQRAVVAALSHFAGETGAQVLVEGVETEDEARVLKELGADLAQGWLFGRPVKVEDINIFSKGYTKKIA